MARNFANWLTSYVKYASVTEAPQAMHFWAGVSAMAGALRRHVWIDMKRYVWSPNFYIIFVAPPGIVAKSTTADISMELLKKVPGINFGPDVVTWQALATEFAKVGESFLWGDEWIPQSAMTLVASELGNLIQPQDREMVNLYITLWDGRKELKKVTKGSGNDAVEAPWINLLGCTTPHWIADNMPPATVGGGFTSRCVFVYAEKKEKFVAYVDEMVNGDDVLLRDQLIQDLEHIATNIIGPYTVNEAAREWGRAWYEDVWTNRPPELEDERLDGYLARKQTHLHKLAIIMAAAQRDERVILKEDLMMANVFLRQSEADLSKVFSRIGRTEEAAHMERFLQLIERRGEVSYAEAFRHVQTFFTDLRDFEGMLNGCLRAGKIRLVQKGTEFYLAHIMR